MLKIVDVMYSMATHKVALSRTEFFDGNFVFLWWFPRSDYYLLELSRNGEIKNQLLFSKLGKAVVQYNNWVKDYPKV